MKIIVLFKLVPDLVEELNIDESNAALDTTWLRLIINEFDDHAIEQAILLKERGQAHVTVVAPDTEGVDDVLFTAAAKGADRLIKLVGEIAPGVNNHALARALASILRDLQPDLILTGVQASNDLDGSVGPLLAEYLGMPYVGYISGLEALTGKVIVHKEYPAGLIGNLEVTLPAVVGIQAAEKPPRYVAVSKVRQTMKTAALEEMSLSETDPSGGLAVSRMYLPEATRHATMLHGSEEEIATKLVELFKEAGIL